jgi:phosphoribosyl 1,2-cyclic phosphodiesterase
MRVTIVASGSRGNSLVIDAGQTRIAVDAGFGTRNLAKRYRGAGIEPESVSACILTHEHTDHAQGALAARKRWHWTIAATPPTLAAIGAGKLRGNISPVEYGSATHLGDVVVTLFPVSHDAAAPAAVLVEDGRSGARLGIAYDLGVVPDTLAQSFGRLDILVIEANHDFGMLRTGPYPLHLQQRIASARGHLSNEQSAEFAREMVHPGLRTVVLAHLSEQNNTPQIARQTVGVQLRRVRFRGRLGAATQDKACAVGDVREVQLSLLF